MRSAIRLTFAAISTIAAIGAYAQTPSLSVGEATFVLTVTEGLEATPVEVGWRGNEVGSWSGADGHGLAFRATGVTVGSMGQMSLQVRNDGDIRRLLELTLAAPVVLDPASAQYWDGSFRVMRPIPGEQTPEEERERGSCPLSAVGDATREYVLGITPDTMISYAEPELIWDPAGGGEYSLAVRMVLDPGQTEGITFCAGEAPLRRWGFLQAAWQAYREAFPQYFEIRPGVPDAWTGTSAMYQSWWHGEVDRERLRRLGCTWDWCYAPFKRAGDMWGRADEWDFTPLAKSYEERPRSIVGVDMATGALEEFHAARAAHFAEYGYDCGQLFYTPSGLWVEKQLAQEKFADAIVENDEIATELSQWVTGNDTEVLVQATGTSYGERLREDYRLIAENLDIAGFAFDVCMAGQRNYAPAVQQPLAGRSWDERGVFFDLGIGIVEQMAYIRGLNWSHAPFEQPLIVGSGWSFTAWHSDAALLELTLTGEKRDQWPLARMALGSKPGVIWKGYDLTGLVQDPAALSRADFLLVFSKLADYIYLKSFQWGLFPGYNYLPGMDKMQRDMPLLRELVKAGWQAVCPMEVASELTLWTGRYGTGAGTYFVLANPNEDVATAQVTVHNDTLGPADCVFINRAHPIEPLAQTIADRRTHLRVNCPKRRPTVLQSVLALHSDRPLECTASVAANLNLVTTTVRVTAPATATAVLELPERPGYSVRRLTLNETPVNASAQLNLRAGENVIEIVYASRHFALSQAQLEGFGWVTEAGAMTFTAVAPEPERRDYRRVIGHLDRYFRYYAQHALGVDEPVPLTVVTDAAQVTTPWRVELLIGPEADGDGWSLEDEGRALVLRAPDEPQAIRRTQDLIAALDRRFEYVVPWMGQGGIGGGTLTERNLWNLTMTEALAQEGLSW